jgi:outer membrane protein OmpA-like peptidoglycan-associated protein
MKKIGSILLLSALLIYTGCKSSNVNFLDVDTTSASIATNDAEDDGKSKKSDKVKKSFEEEEYSQALTDYLEELEDEPASPTYNYYVAESYRKLGKIYMAKDYYAKAIQGGYNDEELELHYAKALKVNGDYDQAEKVLTDYLNFMTVEKYAERARRELSNLQKIDSLSLIVKKVEVSEATGINTENLEYSPFVHDNELYFATAREEATFERFGVPFSDIYKAQLNGLLIEDNSVVPLPPLFNTAQINEGSLTISPDGNTIVFAKGNSSDKRGRNNISLFISTKKNGNWSTPVLMPINSPDAWDTSPAFSRDGKTLYFASDRPGGSGGSDIYRATLNDRGRWGGVSNMGAAINTGEDEVFPYISPDNKLYFASEGHIGFGMLDIFVAVRKDGKISIENMGASVNSPYDDFGLVYSDYPFEGFFTSNRPGGAGQDDIYTLVDNSPDLKKIEYVLKGKSYQINEDSVQVILPGVRVRLMTKNLEQVDDMITAQGGIFEFPIDPEKEYVLIGEKTNFFTSRHDVSTIGGGIDQEDLVERYTKIEFNSFVELTPIVEDAAIVLENILYDLDKSEIRSSAAAELDKLVQLLVDNPEIEIELSSHTDSQAGADYNIRLSQRRAQAAVDYIISKGIARKRLVAKGYGESQLINGCTNDVDCTDEQHQVNRRTEFKVTEYNKEGN